MTDMSGVERISPGAECPRIHSRGWAYGQIRRKSALGCELTRQYQSQFLACKPAASAAAEPPEEPPGIRS